MRLEFPRIESLQTGCGAASIAFVGMNRDTGALNYLFRFKARSGEINVHTTVGIVTSVPAREKFLAETGNELLDLSTPRSRNMSRITPANMGTRLKSGSSGCPSARAIRASWRDAFCELFLEYWSSYKYNNDDDASNPAGFYPDTINFLPYDLNRRFRATLHAGPAAKLRRRWLRALAWVSGIVRDSPREEAVTGFPENLVDVVPGFLLDPQLKLWFQFGGGSGLEFNQTYLRIGYDPELDPDRIFVPPSEEDRRVWLMSPLTAHLADAPKVFRSKRYDEVEHLTLSWTAHEDRIRYKIETDLYLFRLAARIIEKKGYPAISDDGRDTLLYAVRSAPRITSVNGDDFTSPEYAWVKSIEVWIHTDVLDDFFNLPLAEFISPEPGWVILASREIVR